MFTPQRGAAARLPAGPFQSNALRRASQTRTAPRDGRRPICHHGRMQRGPALGFLIIGTAIFGLGVLVELPMLLMSPMMFDAPGSEQSIYPWLILGSLLLNPLFVLVGLLLGWIAFARQAYGKAVTCLVIPALGAGLVFGSFALLQVVCDGNFVCR